MKNITQATEKRIKDMIKRGHKYGRCLQQLLDDMKGREGWLGGSISEMKKSGVELENNTQIHIWKSYAPLYFGLSHMFPDYLYTVDCCDLHYVSIYDFNALVKAVDGMEHNGWL